MDACRAGTVAVLVSSDHMTRGIDLPNIRLVVNYDPPKHVKTYVHRAGRTARALRSGHCVTLLNVGQLGSFKKLRLEVDPPLPLFSSSSSSLATPVQRAGPPESAGSGAGTGTGAGSCASSDERFSSSVGKCTVSSTTTADPTIAAAYKKALKLLASVLAKE
jgi:superfamily II DNA/RNA helicase